MSCIVPTKCSNNKVLVGTRRLSRNPPFFCQYLRPPLLSLPLIKRCFPWEVTNKMSEKPGSDLASERGNPGSAEPNGSHAWTWPPRKSDRLSGERMSWRAVAQSPLSLHLVSDILSPSLSLSCGNDRWMTCFEIITQACCSGFHRTLEVPRSLVQHRRLLRNLISETPGALWID